MKKRSAMFVAAGLVLAMIVAGVGFAMGMTGPTADAKKAPLHVKAKQKPIVHTVTKTITIHKKAKASDDGPATSTPVIYQSTAPTTSTAEPTTSTSTSSESESENESTEHETESSSDTGSDDSPSGSTSSGEGGDD